jgi:hypothetical protein
MRDDVAETVANNFLSVVTALEGMGLRRKSILKGMEIAVKRLRAKGSTGEAQGPAND